LYRRRISLSQQGDHVLAELEDDCHGFRVQLFHDGQQVTAIEPETLRVPLNTCSGAGRPLQQLVGTRLDAASPAILAAVDQRSNCTHLYDLTLLAIHHAGRSQPQRTYDVEVLDPPRDGGSARCEVFCDGVSIHRWQLDFTTIVEPEELAGRPVLHGFAAWANRAFSGNEQEAAFVLCKGVFVSLSRMHDMSNIHGLQAVANQEMRGVCYSYSEAVIDHAHYLGSTVHDFTDTPEQLLKFQ